MFQETYKEVKYFVIILLFILAAQHGFQDLSFLTKDWTLAQGSESIVPTTGPLEFAWLFSKAEHTGPSTD